MAEEAAVLIAAISGRALAQSARRGGYQPLVVDFFADQDTLEIAKDHIRLTGKLARGIEENDLFNALDMIAARHHPIGIVCGSGFEDRAELLERLTKRWRLFGNGAALVAKVKDPVALSAICTDAAIPFPEFSLEKPTPPVGWLAKRRGGSGGGHIKPAARSVRGAIYYQRSVAGIPISALFISHGANAKVIGFSSQWTLPTVDKPYRYGGAAQPATLPADVAASLTAAVNRLAAAVGLVGLNSVDFLVDNERFWLVDINPRPGATLDIFEFESRQGSLFALHMAACAGKLLPTPHPDGSAKAAAIVYAENDIRSVPSLAWPHWTADRPRSGSTIEAGEPLCTIYARGSDVAAARALADERRKLVLAWTRAGQA
jgi:uncharacterized protein